MHSVAREVRSPTPTCNQEAACRRQRLVIDPHVLSHFPSLLRSPGVLRGMSDNTRRCVERVPRRCLNFPPYLLWRAASKIVCSVGVHRHQDIRRATIDGYTLWQTTRGRRDGETVSTIFACQYPLEWQRDRFRSTYVAARRWASANHPYPLVGGTTILLIKERARGSGGV